MLKSKKSLIIILLILIFSVGIISIAFAALSQTLNITSGKVTQNALGMLDLLLVLILVLLVVQAVLEDLVEILLLQEML